MELTTPLPCRHLSPSSRISHLEESTITGTRAMSGSAAMRLRKVRMARLPSSMASSMLTSMSCAPPSTWLRATSRASSYFSSRIRRLKRAEPVTLVRSPTLTKSESGPMLKASRPDRRVRGGSSRRGRRGGRSATASAMARMCSGVVPQQPPTMLIQPASAHWRMCPAMNSGLSSYSPNSLGRPALGCTEVRQVAMAVESHGQGAGVAQGVVEGLHRLPRCSKKRSTANTAALAFKVSKMVSMRMRSAPPSSQTRGLPVDLVGQVFHVVVGQGDGVGVEGVGLDDVRAGGQVGLVDAADDVRLGEDEEVVVALQLAGMVLEARPPVVRLVELMGLDHGAHGPVQDEDALGQQGFDGVGHQHCSQGRPS